MKYTLDNAYYDKIKNVFEVYSCEKIARKAGDDDVDYQMQVVFANFARAYGDGTKCNSLELSYDKIYGLKRGVENILENIPQEHQNYDEIKEVDEYLRRLLDDNLANERREMRKRF